MLPIGLVYRSEQLAKAGRPLDWPKSLKAGPKQVRFTSRKQRDSINRAVFFVSGHFASPRYERVEAAEEPRVTPQVRRAFANGLSVLAYPALDNAKAYRRRVAHCTRQMVKEPAKSRIVGVGGIEMFGLNGHRLETKAFQRLG
jgi:hypothetical protein